MSNRSPNSVDAAVGRNVRFYRLAARMSQAALGEKIGVSFQQVQKYEKGLNRIGAGRLTQIGRVLRVPVVSFFEGVPERPDIDRSDMDRSDIDRSDMDRADMDRSAPRGSELLAEPTAFRLARAFAEVSHPGLRLSIVNLVEEIIRDERKP
jgi:transcriptional regulator with XRE-family HTH domain